MGAGKPLFLCYLLLFSAFLALCCYKYTVMFHVKLVFDLKGVCLLYGFILCQVRLLCKASTTGNSGRHIVVEWASSQCGGHFLFFTASMKTKSLLSGQPTAFWKLVPPETPHCRRLQQNKCTKRLIFLLKFCRTGLIHAFTQC